jgi:hypothetical protein
MLLAKADLLVGNSARIGETNKGRLAGDKKQQPNRQVGLILGAA